MHALPCLRCSKCLWPWGERDPGLTLASALLAPSAPVYLGKSCSTSQPLSRGDGRGTRWDRSHAGSPGGHPHRCIGCRARGRRHERPGATPPRGSTSSRHAHRLNKEGEKEGESGPQTWPGPLVQQRVGWALGEPSLYQSCLATLPAKHRPGYKTCPLSLTLPTAALRAEMGPEGTY